MGNIELDLTPGILFNLQNSESKLVKRALYGKLEASKPVGIIAHICQAIEQPNRMWFVVSGSVSQRG